MTKINYKNYIYPALLLGIVVVLFVTNYKPGTWLLGWDNLQSELNFSLNLSRNFYAGWQEYQGLGLASGHAHTVEFVRLITYFWLFLLTPNFLTRYLFHFLMLFLGSFFVFRLCKDELLKDLENSKEFSFVASLFYLLSLGTMQNFYVPLEAYSVFYAYLPLVTLYLLRFIKTGGRKNLLFYSVANLLIVPAFHIQTYFIVLVIYLFVPLGVYALIKRNVLKKYLVALMTLIIINLFWLLSVVYFVFSNVSVRLNSHINRFSSTDNFLKNVQFGNLYDVPLLRGFWFQNIDYLGSEKGFSYMLSSWINWYGNKVIVLISYSIFALVLIGLFQLFKNKEKNRYILLYLFLVSIFFLFNQNGALGFIYQLLLHNIPLFAEVFRFPFTKFIVPSILIYSILFAFGLSKIYKIFERSIPIKVFISVVFIVLVYYALPAFQGGLVYGNLRVKLPDYYIETIDYFKTQDSSKRLATLPQESFWDWKYTSWGFRGGGFLWYGIEQPILDRAFDVWNHSNEQFYDEFQYGVYSENTNLLASTFQKYDVRFLILDKSIIAPGAPNATFIPQTKKLLESLKPAVIPEKSGIQKVTVTLDKTYGDIEVYKINLPVKSNKWVVAPEKYINTQTEFTFSNVDSFSSLGLPYVSSSTSDLPSHLSAEAEAGVLLDFSFADDNKLAVAVSKDDLQLGSIFPKNRNLKEVNVPNLPTDKPIPANLTINANNLNIQYIYPSIVSGGKIVYAPKFSEAKEIGNQDKNLLINNKLFLQPKMATLLDKNSSAIVFDSKLSGFTDLSNDIYTAFSVDCGGGMGEFGKRVNVSAKSVEVFLKNKNSCVVFMSDLAVKTASVLKVEFEYKATEGSRPLYCLSYNDTGECLNEKYENAPKAISNDFVKYVDYIYVANSVNFKFLAILESDDKQKEQSAEFRNIAITSYNVLQNISLAPDANAYNIAETIEVFSQQAQVVLPNYSNLNKNYPAGDQAYNTTPKNCDNFNETSFDRKYSLGKYTYEAEDAVSCDSLDTENINTNSSYLVDFVYKNIEGKGLDLCFASGSLQKCMLQDRLLTVKGRVYDTGNVKTESFIMPSYPSAEKIQINIGNQSIGRVKTVNELYQVQTRYIPYEWLKNIYTSTTPGVVGKPLGLSNRLKVIDVKKTHTYKYEVTTNGGNGLVVLNQSFDKGWIMFPKVHFPNFPDVRKDHVLVSNWANGWVINDTATTSDTKYTIHNTSYIVLFWPQYMQFVGYFILGLWIVYLLLLTIRKRLS